MGKVDEVQARFKQLQAERQVWESHWQEIGDYVITRKSDVTSKSAPGEKKNLKIFDGTAGRALELLAASLHGLLTSPTQRWFNLGVAEVAKPDDDARTWLEDTARRMYLAFQRSNFSQEIHETYFDLGAFGTDCLFTEMSDEGTLMFSARHISEIYIAENQFSRVDVIYRNNEWTVSALAKRFGVEKLHEKVRDLVKDNPDAKIDVVHAVQPRENRDKSKDDARNMPFESIWLDLKHGHIMAEGGFHELPYAVSRWLKTSWEVYGRSPAMTALPDIKMINSMSKTILRAAQKAVDPPLQMPDDGFLNPVRTIPGGINYRRPGVEKIEPLATNANIPLGLEMENQRRDQIREAFFIPQLTLVENPNMTATETLQRKAEQQRFLGPTIGRLQSEKLQVVIDRAFGLMFRAGQFLDPPESIAGQNLQVEYTNPISISQRLDGVDNVRSFISIVGEVAQLKPEVLDLLDGDGITRALADMLGVPSSVIVSEEVLQESRQAAEQAAAEQTGIDQAAQIAGAAQPAAQAVASLADLDGGADVAQLLQGGG